MLSTNPKLLMMNDEQVARALKKQIHAPENKYDCGIRNDDTVIPSASHGGTPAYMAAMTAALIAKDSRYYQDLTVLNALDKAADYLLTTQHNDGTISLGGTNFNSPPDTGFVVAGVTQIYHLLHRDSWERLKPITLKVKLFLERTIPAFLTGGCHTPNHRWVITAALGSLYEIFRLDALKERANEWLAEGMDCTEDGEWTERSNGIYNAVSDIMLYYTAKYLNRPDLLNHVRRNLKMMLYMIHPNGDIVTDYSGRQDFGGEHNLSGYYLSYKLMADLDRDPIFATMADLSLANMTDLGSVNNHALLGSLLFPCDIDSLERQPLPKSYSKVFNMNHPITEDLRQMAKVGHHSRILHSSMHTSFGAPVVRYRNDSTSVTAMTRTPSIFSLRHGRVKLLGIRISTMFTPGIVEMEQFSLTESGYYMCCVMEKGYNGPIPKESLPETAGMNISPWYLLPHHLRSLTHVQRHQIEVYITQHGQSWSIQVKSDDIQDVLTQVSFVFSSDCKLTGNALEPIGEHMQLWTKDTLRCSSGEDWIEITGGQLDHQLRYTRNAPVQSGVQTAVVNLLSPFDKTFQLKLS